MFRKLGLSMPWTEQRPGEEMDYCIDFIDCLAAGETLSSPVVSADAGLTVMSASPPYINPAALSVVDESGSAYTIGAGQAVILWLSGGVIGSRYDVSVSAHTSGGRVVQRTFQVRVVE